MVIVVSICTNCKSMVTDTSWQKPALILLGLSLYKTVKRPSESTVVVLPGFCAQRLNEVNKEDVRIKMARILLKVLIIKILIVDYLLMRFSVLAAS